MKILTSLTSKLTRSLIITTSIKTLSLTRCSSNRRRRIGQGNMFNNNSIINRLQMLRITSWGLGKRLGESGVRHVCKWSGESRKRGRRRARQGLIWAVVLLILGGNWMKSLCFICLKWSSDIRCLNLHWTSMPGWELSSGARPYARWVQALCGREIETCIPCYFWTR